MSELPAGIHANPRADVWARAFIDHIKDHPELALNEGFMIGWFANAMVAMHDNI